MCKRCFDVGPQIVGTIRPHMEEFNVWREMTSKDRYNNKNTITDPGTEVYEELQRLVNGYRNHLSKSKIKSFVAEALSLVKIPEWQKSKCWMVRKYSEIYILFSFIFLLFDQPAKIYTCVNNYFSHKLSTHLLYTVKRIFIVETEDN